MDVRWLTIFLDLPPDSFDDAARWWADVAGCTVSPTRGAAGEFATLAPRSGDPHLRVQRVQEAPQDAGGCHLDVHVSGSLSVAAEEAVGLGAVLAEPGEDLVVLRSPGGLPFCLVPWGREASLAPPHVLSDAPGAGSSRLDQLCLDIPGDVYDRECRFWADLTGWDLHASPARPEFSSLSRPPGVAVRLLLQRRDRWHPRDRVTGHVDLACGSGRDALAAAHVERGARVEERFPFWVQLTDPWGRPYCLTGRDPLTGTLA